jgi:hypothetical protein
MTKRMQQRWRFFHEWAGYATPPGKAVCAMDLARAEQWAEDEGLAFEWSIDPDIDYSDHSDEQPPYALWQVLCQHGDESASLCGIDFGRDREPWGDNYKRVVEAELAHELQTEFFTALAAHIGQL